MSVLNKVPCTLFAHRFCNRKLVDNVFSISFSFYSSKEDFDFKNYFSKISLLIFFFFNNTRTRVSHKYRDPSYKYPITIIIFVEL